jgi:hypothetical protein
MQNQPSETRVHLMKPIALFKIIMGLSILYVGAILLFAKFLHTLLQP